MKHHMIKIAVVALITQITFAADPRADAFRNDLQKPMRLQRSVKQTYSSSWGTCSTEMQRLLEMKVDPERLYFEDRPLLYETLLHGDRALCASMLQHDANPNVTNSIGNSPLYCVTNLADAQLLIQYGADWKHINLFDRNLLHHAGATAKHVALVKLYCDLRVNPNAQDRYGFTPMHDFCFGAKYNKDKKDQELKLELLLMAGGKLTIRDGNGQTPLDILKRECPELARSMEARMMPVLPKQPAFVPGVTIVHGSVSWVSGSVNGAGKRALLPAKKRGCVIS